MVTPAACFLAKIAGRKFSVVRQFVLQTSPGRSAFCYHFVSSHDGECFSFTLPAFNSPGLCGGVCAYSIMDNNAFFEACFFLRSKRLVCPYRVRIS